MSSSSSRAHAATAALAVLSTGALAYVSYRAAVARRRRVLVLVSGTLQDGFALRGNLDAPGAPAAFMGMALVRGVKMYLDVKPEGCREWVDPSAGGAQAVNPALVCTGDASDANVYACFAVSESAALRALLGEPRCLGMTPDTVLVDLDARETTPALAATLRALAAASAAAAAPITRAALLTVVAHAPPHGAVSVPPLYVKDDGTRVTTFAECLSAFAKTGGGGGLEAAARAAQKAAREVGGGSLRYGADPETPRMNFAMDAGALRAALRKAEEETGARPRG